MTNGKLIRHENWRHQLTPEDYAKPNISATVMLLICDDDIPSEYQSRSGNSS